MLLTDTPNKFHYAKKNYYLENYDLNARMHSKHRTESLHNILKMELNKFHQISFILAQGDTHVMSKLRNRSKT